MPKTQKIFTGVTINHLTTHPDERGLFTEIFRDEWKLSKRPIQWNVVNSKKGVLRGVHVHIKHHDYLVIIQGKAVIALKDLRPKSKTYMQSTTIEVSGDNLQALVIPPGVAHAFLFLTDAVHVYSVSRYWDTEDELGFNYLDPELGITWPKISIKTSDRDAQLPPLSELQKSLTTKGF